MNEQPLLYTPHTQLLREAPTTLPKAGVLKRTNGCQGTEVFFLDEANHSILIETQKSWGPCGAVMQDYVSRSVLTPFQGSKESRRQLRHRPISGRIFGQA
jgi:hypothetical protein